LVHLRSSHIDNRELNVHLCYHGVQSREGAGRQAGRQTLRDVRCVGMDWIQLAQDRVRWQVLVETAKKLQVHKSGWGGGVLD
jgi:hypothetical protein